MNHECVNTWSIGSLECSWSVFEPVWSRFFKTALVCKDFWVRQYHKSLFPKWTSIVHSQQEFENIFWLKNYLRINFPKKKEIWNGRRKSETGGSWWSFRRVKTSKVKIIDREFFMLLSFLYENWILYFWYFIIYLLDLQ